MTADRVLIASMPWAHYYMPSIQVGALKAFLIQNKISAEGAHWFLEVAHALGFRCYNNIWFPYLEDGEALYSYLLFPGMRPGILNDARLRQKSRDALRLGRSEIPFHLTPQFFRDFEKVHTRILDRYEWNRYAVVGFTLNFAQTAASLYMARRIKERNPRCKIVIGGAEACRQLGASLVRNFREFDFAVNGEGEKPFSQLCQEILRGTRDEELARLPGVIGRLADDIMIGKPDQVGSLDQLPSPDFGEYFQQMDTFGDCSRFEINSCLPIEASRGCYYACTFCALNLQWEGMRTGSSERLARLMTSLSERYEILDFFFVDNISPTNSDELFDHLATLNRDYRFFFEIRANIKRSTLATMKRAGLTRVQVGFEALSTDLLRKFHKKSTTIQNVLAMKNCAELGLATVGNLIINHPLSDHQDIQNTLANIALLKCYPPPDDVADFAMQVGSPDFASEVSGAVAITGNYREYSRVYPPELFTALDLPRKEFTVLREVPDWGPVVTALENWKSDYNAVARQTNGSAGHLIYMDGGTFLRVEDFRSGTKEVYILDSRERKVLLSCSQIAHWLKLKRDLIEFSEEQLAKSLNGLIDAELVFREGEYYLSLPLPSRSKVEQEFPTKVVPVTRDGAVSQALPIVQ